MHSSSRPGDGPGSAPPLAKLMGVGMRVLVLGGDGFCGWPTSLYLSDRGHEITIIDNLSRRKIDIDLEVESLTPIRPISERLRAWKEVSGKEINFISLDLANEYDRLVAVLRDLRPEAIVHFAEQRAAPYSMRSTATKRYTVDNNVRATHNLLTALVDTGIDAALAHLGTMGVYGYGWSGTAPIPEGYLTVKVPTPDGELEREILHPANPGSVYHMTKTLDQLLFSFYAKNDELAITDPPATGSKPLVLNQVTEVHRVVELAKMVADRMGVEVAYLPNPRQEAEENELRVRNDQFLALGLEPTTLSEGLLEECTEIASKYRDRVDPTKIIARSVWRKGMEVAGDLMTEVPDGTARTLAD